MYYFQNLSGGIDASATTQFSFMPHLHEKIEIVYIENGSTEVTVNGKKYTVGSNSLVVVFPFQIHSYRDDMDKISGYLLFCSPNELSEIKNKISSVLPTEPVITNISDEVKYLIHNIANECNQAKHQKYLNEICRGYALALFGKLLPLLKCEKQQNTNLTTTQILLNYCYNNYTTPLTLDQVAKELSINKFYISHIFNNKLSIGFNDYLAILRVAEAKKILKNTDTSITNVAYDVGFATIRSFNRRFKEFANMTPKEYRKLSREENA